MAPLAIDPIMLGISLHSFRHHEYQYLSNILDYIGRNRMLLGKSEDQEEQEQRRKSYSYRRE